MGSDSEDESIIQVQSLQSLERSKRRIIRTLDSLKDQIESAFTQNPSEDLADKIGALIEEIRISLRELKVTTDKILDVSDTSKFTPEQCATHEEQEWTDLVNYHLYLADARGKLRSLLNGLKPSAPVTSLPSAVNTSVVIDAAPKNPVIKPPDIPVPKFDGKIKNFTEWYSQFASTIGTNEDLKPVEKLYYLKQAMTGEAANVLKAFVLEEGLYDTALKYVKERYFNKRVIISNHFGDLLDLPPITLASLRDSLERVSASIRGLKMCDVNIEQMSQFISYVVARKMPEQLRTDWRNANSDTSTYPGYDLLETFLQNRCLSYEDARNKPSVNVPKPGEKFKFQHKPNKTFSSTAVPYPYGLRKCVFCEDEHYLSQCREFLAKSISDRFAFVKDNKLCINCLRRGHFTWECRCLGCRKCSERHNTVLHRDFFSSFFTQKRGAAKFRPNLDPVDADQKKSHPAPFSQSNIGPAAADQKEISPAASNSELDLSPAAVDQKKTSSESSRENCTI